MNSTERILYVSGSPRSGGNTDYMLATLQAELGGALIQLSDYRIEHCRSCWRCLKSGHCTIADDMTARIIPLLLKCDVVVLGSPVYFNNVSADMKAFMDRTWCLRGQLRNRIGGALVVGRRYGAEAAVAAINGFFLKHDMLVANRGVTGVAFRKDEIGGDAEAMRAIQTLAARIEELLSVVKQHRCVGRMSQSHDRTANE